jgi:hypothetical protein
MKTEDKKELVKQLKNLIRRIEKGEIEIFGMEITNETAESSDNGVTVSYRLTGWRTLSFRYFERKGV